MNIRLDNQSNIRVHLAPVISQRADVGTTSAMKYWSASRWNGAFWGSEGWYLTCINDYL